MFFGVDSSFKCLVVNLKKEKRKNELCKLQYTLLPLGLAAGIEVA